MKIIVDGEEWDGTSSVVGPTVAIDMWYDRHERLWTLYGVDSNGYITTNTEYARTRAEAKQVKSEMEAEFL